MNLVRLARRALLGTLFAAAALAPLASHAQTVAELKKKGEITVGMLVDFPPYGTLNSSNQPDGYDADVARLLGKDWGVKINLVPVTGPNRIPFLLTNKVDILIASLAVTPERARQVLFSKPYAAASIVVYGSKKAAIKTAADLKPLKVGVARASTQDIALTAAAPQGTEIRRFDDDASAMQALMAGQVDAIGCSTTVAAQIDKRTGGAFETKFVVRQQVMGIVMRPGQTELEKALDDFIDKNKANGELNKLYRKWLETDFPSMPNS
ncbi:MAG: transporter substrate-binding domain-containing protein [Proteobacteria bacterium]|nr:transporter substrate-binding domain-containing protein [Pseudomonadota bacterium]